MQHGELLPLLAMAIPALMAVGKAVALGGVAGTLGGVAGAAGQESFTEKTMREKGIKTPEYPPSKKEDGTTYEKTETMTRWCLTHSHCNRVESRSQIGCVGSERLNKPLKKSSKLLVDVDHVVEYSIKVGHTHPKKEVNHVVRDPC